MLAPSFPYNLVFDVGTPGLTGCYFGQQKKNFHIIYYHTHYSDNSTVVAVGIIIIINTDNNK